MIELFYKVSNPKFDYLKTIFDKPRDSPSIIVHSISIKKELTVNFYVINHVCVVFRIY